MRTVEIPPLDVRAAIRSVNEAQRTVEVVFTTGAGVTRSDWYTGKKYIERLSLDPDHIRLERLNNGAPLLDGHSGYSVREDQIGVVESDSVVLLKGEARATVRFSKRASVDDVFNDVKDGIVRNVSVGYVVNKYVEEDGDNKIPVRTAVDWEPYEISMVPMPADNAAKVRSKDQAVTHPCVIETRGSGVKLMERETPEFIAEEIPNPAPKADPPVEQNERDAGADAERTRIDGIFEAVRAARLPLSVYQKYVAAKTPLVDAQREIFRELSRRDLAASGPQTGSGPSLQVGDDPLVHKRSGIENALLHRMAPDYFKLEDHGKEYRGLSLTDTARVFLGAIGVRTTGLSRTQLWDEALKSRAGLHTTSDFANLLADLPNKILQKAYQEAPQTFEALVRRTTVSDFKPNRLLEIGEAPALLEVLEHGEVKHGTIGEGKETFSLLSYARQFGITRKALVNDDTDAFSRLPIMMGRQVRKLESDLVWAQITANAAMGDSVALFHSTHGNLAGSGTAISVTSVAVANAAMKLQKGIDGATFIDVAPKYIIVPVAQEVVALQFVSPLLQATSQSAVNPFTGRFSVISDPRLDANSTTAWYLAASPDQIGIIVVATLEGESGPRVESKVGFDIQGIQTKVEYDFAAKVENHRGLYKNPGA